MQGENKNIKNKIISTLKIMLAMGAIMGGIALYSKHEDARRAEYARQNNCTWSYYAGHDICK